MAKTSSNADRICRSGSHRMLGSATLNKGRGFVRRRDFIALTGAAAAFPRVVFAQQASNPATPAPPSGPETPTLDNLVEGGGWDCLPGGSLADGKAVIQADTGGAFQVSVNDYRFQLKTSGDFSIAATIETSTNDYAGLRFWNSLPPPPQQPQITEWYTSSPQLTVALVNGQVSLTILDGTSPNPAFQQGTRGTQLSGPVALVLKRAGDELILNVNGTEAMRTRVLGPFANGPIIHGVAIAPGGQLAIATLTVSEGVQIVRPLVAAGALSGQAPSLRTLASPRGRLIGAFVASRQIRWNQPYVDTVRREFSMLALADAFNWKTIHPGRASYQFCDADQLVAFAKANDMQVHVGHLSWSENPDWLTKGNFSRAELMDILHEHIQTLVSRYRGQVTAWNVVNEVFEYTNSGRLRDTIWLDGIGPEYIHMAFRWAHEEDPQALLLLNETGAEGLSPKSDAVFGLVKGLLARGVPISGVGMQTHWGAFPRVNATDTAPQVAANMKRLAGLGQDVYVTEMDVAIQEPVTAEKLAAQAKTYRDILGVCLAATNCKAFITWGVFDGDSWLLDRPKYNGLAAPLLFDESFRPKPVYRALIDLLRQR